MSVVDRSPERVDWNFTRGDTWSLDFVLSVPTTGSPITGVPADLSGSTWLLQVREAEADGPLFATATVDATSQSIGVVLATVASTATTGAMAGTRGYYYDLEQTLGGKVATPVGGYINVGADASRF